MLNLSKAAAWFESHRCLDRLAPALGGPATLVLAQGCPTQSWRRPAHQPLCCFSMAGRQLRCHGAQRVGSSILSQHCYPCPALQQFHHTLLISLFQLNTRYSLFIIDRCPSLLPCRSSTTRCWRCTLKRARSCAQRRVRAAQQCCELQLLKRLVW